MPSTRARTQTTFARTATLTWEPIVDKLDVIYFNVIKIKDFVVKYKSKQAFSSYRSSLS
jgi:hypothetical protein